MELLFVVLGAAGLGAIPRYLLPHRDTYGSALLPSVSAAVASIVWAALTWLGWPFDGGWIWWASLGAGLLAAILVPLLIAAPRRKHDEELFAQLAHP
ncbi:MAG: hypothetical protein ABIW32_04220 [Terrimesophilobacter sp.]